MLGRRSMAKLVKRIGHRQVFRIQEVVIAMRLRRGNLDAAAAMSAPKGSPTPTRLPRCARNDTFPASLNSYGQRWPFHGCIENLYF